MCRTQSQLPFCGRQDLNPRKGGASMLVLTQPLSNIPELPAAYLGQVACLAPQAHIDCVLGLGGGGVVLKLLIRDVCTSSHKGVSGLRGAPSLCLVGEVTEQQVQALDSEAAIDIPGAAAAAFEEAVCPGDLGRKGVPLRHCFATHPKMQPCLQQERRQQPAAERPWPKYAVQSKAPMRLLSCKRRAPVQPGLMVSALGRVSTCEKSHAPGI